MYGANYSGFAFHPKAIRMVGPVHFGVFWPIGRAVPAQPATAMCARGLDAHRQAVQNRGPTSLPLTVFPIDRPILIPCAVRLTGIAGCVAHNARYAVQAGRIGTIAPITALRLVAPALIPNDAAPCPKNKNGVFHVKHAARFPPPAPTIKPSSSPARGRFRSRADSAPARPPALPPPTHPFQARSHSPRSAVPPARSARSAASRRLCRATR